MAAARLVSDVAGHVVQVAAIAEAQFGFTELDITRAIDLLVALAIGLLIGLEREWRKRDADDHARIGIRTFGLIGLLGGLAATLQGAFGPWLAPASLLAITILLVNDRRAGGRQRGAILIEDLTTLVAALVTALLGFLAAGGATELAVAGAVVVAALLYLKPTLHGIVSRLTEVELRATLRFLVISLVILPVLPNRGFGPDEAFNPRDTWLMVVLISALSFAGYVAIRMMGAAVGVLATAMLGGTVSSTLTTITFAKMAGGAPQQGVVLAAGAILANTMMSLRVMVLTFVISPPLAYALALPLGLASATAGLFVVIAWMASTRGRIQAEGLQLRNPFELVQAMKFTLLLLGVQLLSRFLTERFGEAGLYALAATAGLADIDAITLSVARDLPGGLGIQAAVYAILVAMTSSILLKGAIIARSGGIFARWSLGALAAMLAAAGLGVLLQAG